jgi:hypothetical protein
MDATRTAVSAVPSFLPKRIMGDVILVVGTLIPHHVPTKTSPHHTEKHSLCLVKGLSGGFDRVQRIVTVIHVSVTSAVSALMDSTAPICKHKPVIVTPAKNSVPNMLVCERPQAPITNVDPAFSGTSHTLALSSQLSVETLGMMNKS